MKKVEFVCLSDSVEKTIEVAEHFARFLQSGDVVSLIGDLGAGKTAFTKGLASGIGIEAMISSPTFMLVMEHKNKRGLDLFHFDVYRLTGSGDFYDAGLDEYFDKDGICVIEWGNIVADALPDHTIEVELKWSSDSQRKLRFSFPANRENTVRLFLENSDLRGIEASNESKNLFE